MAQDFTPKQLMKICDLSSSALYEFGPIMSAEERRPLEGLHERALDQLSATKIKNVTEICDVLREQILDIMERYKCKHLLTTVLRTNGTVPVFGCAACGEPTP